MDTPAALPQQLRKAVTSQHGLYRVTKDPGGIRTTGCHNMTDTHSKGHFYIITATTGRQNVGDTNPTRNLHKTTAQDNQSPGPTLGRRVGESQYKFPGAGGGEGDWGGGRLCCVCFGLSR